MDLIDSIRLGLLVFDFVGLAIVARYPTPRQLAEYESWLGFLDKEFREKHRNGGS